MDSILWVGILDDLIKFNDYIKCIGLNYVFGWIEEGSNFSFKNAMESIRTKGQVDQLAKGIWGSDI